MVIGVRGSSSKIQEHMSKSFYTRVPAFPYDGQNGFIGKRYNIALKRLAD